MQNLASSAVQVGRPRKELNFLFVEAVQVRFYRHNFGIPEAPTMIVLEALATSARRKLARLAALGFALFALSIGTRGGVPATQFCFGDSSSGICPCDPVLLGAPFHGCPNSFSPNGATLFGGHFQLTVVIGGNSASYGLMIKGNAALMSGGVASGDGIRCVDGQLIRFGGHNAGTNGAPLGTWTYPNAVQTVPIAVATGQPPGELAYYQLYYRNLAPICNPSTTNMSNALALQW